MLPVQDTNERHQQQLQDFEARERALHLELADREERIEWLEEQLNEQTAAAKKAAIEYEQKIGAMNREFEKMLSQGMGKLKIILQHDEWIAMKSRAAAADQPHSLLSGNHA